jgi:ATP-binding cassette subfamily F protein 3
VLSGLGFDEDDIRRPVSQLSGGQRTRAQLARLLLDAPDLLLLDEPTNHLDLAGIEWLEGYLKSWKGSLVLVAHDRAFLDATVDRVWDLAWGRLERYRGNYSAYVQQKTDRQARQQVEHERQQEVIAKTEEFIRRNLSGQLSRQAKGRQKRLDRLQRIERVRTYRPLNLSLGGVARSGGLVLGLYDLSVGYAQEAPLLTVAELELRRGDRVALLGPNGSGKTTLLRTVTGEIPALSGRVRIGAAVRLAYFAQGHSELEPDKTVLETIVDEGITSISQARDLLGRYRFSGDDVFKRVGDLSGGEQARVALAILALQGANFLLLDEPTNQLDIPSQEVLQEVFAGFAGSMLIVTHDRYLIRTLTPAVWAIEEGQVWAFDDGYEAYRSWREQRRQSPGDSKAARHKEVLTALEKQRQAHRAAEREAAQQARRRAELEESIHRLETRLADLEAQLALASTEQAVERVRQLGAEYSQVEATLDTLMLAWAELAP